MTDDLSLHLDRLLRPLLGHVPSSWPMTVKRAARRLAKREGVDAIALLSRLSVQPVPALIDELVAVATVPHTKFFRHQEQFEYLEKRVFSEAARTGRRLNVWSAGCASGEEAYSLALTAREAGASCRILATDVSRARIEEARRGTYPARAARAIPGAKGSTWTAPEAIRRMIRFEVASLIGPDPSRGLGPFDLVFCRNVLIYFGVEEGLAVVRVLLERLKPHGALVVAPTEAVVRASWRRPEADAPIGWFVPDRGELPLTARPAPPSPGRSPSSDRPARTELEASLGASEARLEEAARRLSTGEVADAELLLGELLDGDPEHAEGWFLLGEALFSRGELAQARAAFLRASRATRHGRVDAQTLRDAASRRAEACVRR